MIPLSHKEKKEHHHKIDKYVEKINKYILSSIFLKGSKISLKEAYQIKLEQIAYGVLLDSYHYFDFPFTDSEAVDSLNIDLAQNEILKQVDVRVNRRFEDLRVSKGINGYLFYDYYIDEESKTYVLKNTKNNLDYENDAEDLLLFLPVIDCAITNKKNYLFNVESSKDNIKSSQQILVLSEKLGLETEDAYDDNTLVCTFRINIQHPEDTILHEISKLLYKEVFYFLDIYFHSPVLTKLLSGRRKSYVLGYKHNLQQLNPLSAIRNLKRGITTKDADKINRALNEIEQIFLVYELTHHLMFDYELVSAGYTDYDIKYEGKSIFQILKDFEENYNDRKVLTNFCFDKQEHYYPKITPDKNNYELFDFILILWNLWRNGIVHNTKDDLHINGYNKGKEYYVEFINEPALDNDLADYLKGKIPNYPRDTSWKNPYPGLIIIKDLIKSNPKISLEVIADEVINETKIILKILKV
ncbi:hypothetical protein [Winogradskyella tangerina]|uniref:hypothetical protein n=1 Tax=Winogradskyella tangerina TaxID=2023240 RepID=UPI000DBE5D00|nr:hypothetical protein [Winogradskyella tangerina]